MVPVIELGPIYWRSRAQELRHFASATESADVQAYFMRIAHDIEREAAALEQQPHAWDSDEN